MQIQIDVVDAVFIRVVVCAVVRAISRHRVHSVQRPADHELSLWHVHKVGERAALEIIEGIAASR